MKTISRTVICFALLFAFGNLASFSVSAQTPGEKVVVDENTEELGDLLEDQLIADGCVGKCCPPSTADKVMMGVGSLVGFLILLFLFVRLIERAFIKQEKSPMAGRHLGISCALFFGGALAMGIFFLVTGCFWPSYYYILGAIGVIWLLHLIYTFIIIRK